MRGSIDRTIATSNREGGSRLRGIVAFAVVLSVSAVLAYVYYRTVGRPYLEHRIDLHDRILGREAPEPYRFRLLAPFLGEALRRALSTAASPEWAFLLGYAALDFAAVLLFLWVLFVYLRSWFTGEQALVGVLFAAATMPVALRDHYFQPWSLPEAALFTAALLCIHRRRTAPLAAVLVVASLNRETAVFIPVAVLLAGLDAGRDERGRRRIALASPAFAVSMFAVWAGIYFGLRAAVGSGPAAETIAGLFARNTSRAALLRTALRGALVFGAFWAFAALGLRRAPPFARRMSLVVPLYLVPIALWGVWYEVRLLVPLYAIVVPLALSFLFRESAERSP